MSFKDGFHVQRAVVISVGRIDIHLLSLPALVVVIGTQVLVEQYIPLGL
jgi:hypothetical protein